jgi:Xaa-Pro aminopeptidase
VDTQRLFDEEIDGLGFQLKEWPWHWGRAQLLADLSQGRNLAADVPYDQCKLIGPDLARLRRSLTQYEMACLRALGQILSHALEATGRTMGRGETEREIAGQLAHRLYHRGAEPVQVAVAADGRSRTYRQLAFTGASINQYAVMTVTARKYGMCARASRAVAFDNAEPLFRKEYDAACKISATYVAGSWPDSVPRAILASGQRIYSLVGAEHEFFLAPQGHVIGRAPVEVNLTPQDEDLLQANWAVCWHPSVGAAVCCDTFLLTEDGPRAVTPCENWPLKRIRIQGAEFVRPDLLIRT